MGDIEDAIDRLTTLFEDVPDGTPEKEASGLVVQLVGIFLADVRRLADAAEVIAFGEKVG